MLNQIIKILWYHKFKNGLIFIQLLASFLILTAIFYFLNSQWNKYKVPLGFTTENKYIAVRYFDYNGNQADYLANIQNLKSVLQNDKNVKSVSFGNGVYPFSFSSFSSSITINGRNKNFNHTAVDENYAKTMGIKVTKGRWLGKPLAEDQIREVVVNQKFVKEVLDNRSMIDSVLDLNGRKKIVGIVENYKYNGNYQEEVPMLIDYISPYDKNAITVFVEVKENTPAIFKEQLSNLLTETTGINRFLIKNLEIARKEMNRQAITAIIFLIAFGIFIIVNTVMGLYSILLHNVQSRRYEIGLRKAMGASSQKIVGQFMIELLGLTVIAISLGLIFVFQVLYFNLADIDADLVINGLLLSGTFMVFFVVLSVFYPAWRAAQMPPTYGLRED